MKTVIKDLLIELTSLGKKPVELVLLAKAEKNLGIDNLLTLKRWLMQWHKKIARGFPSDDYQKDYFQSSDVLVPKFEALFKSCPELSALYELKEDKVFFNSSLSNEEKEEIIDYVDKNYKIIRHSYGRKPK